MNLLRPTLLFFGFLVFSLSAFAQQTAISYQGKLSSGGADANGPHDLKFRLYDAQSGGTQLGTEILLDDVIVSAGVFTVSLDFGNQFSAAGARWLEIEVRVGTSTGAYTLLSPRSPITSTPFSIQTIRAQFADSAANADAVGGIPASALVQTNDPRLSDARPPTANSGNYIQNTASLQPQAASNFNISGTGRANLFLASDVDSNNGYRLSGQPFLNQLAGNLALGISAGSPNVGTDNSLVGFGAGLTNTSNSQFNSFFGMNSGRNNNGGTWNTYIGWRSGWNINNGNFNTAIGASSGANITSGSSNSIFGASAGRFVTNGSNNSFFGYLATGETSTNDSTAIGAFAYAPNSNTVVIGGVAGQNNATLTPNVGIGTTAPTARLHVVGNTLFDGTLQFSGSLTGNGSSLTNLNAGALTTGTVPQARLGNSVIFNQTDQQATSNFNISGDGRAGGTIAGNIVKAETRFDLGSSPILRIGSSSLYVGRLAGSTISGLGNTFIGDSAGEVSAESSSQNTFVGAGSGADNTTGIFNTFVGAGSGGTAQSGQGNSSLGALTQVASPEIANSTAIGYRSIVSQSNSIVLGSISGINGAKADTNVGIGTTNPSQRLHVVGNGLFSGDVTVNGTLNANLPAGSGNYIQNSTTQQSTSNFNISGTGTATILNAGTQINLGGNRIVAASVPEVGGLYFGFQSGTQITTGFSNSFFGTEAGQSTSSGHDNSFFGNQAGKANTVGWGNSFFGRGAGLSNTDGLANSFFGGAAGQSNTTGDENSFFGGLAGLNSNSNRNSFFGWSAGRNSNGQENAFFGWSAGLDNTVGYFNSFLGSSAGRRNTQGYGNAFFGFTAGEFNTNGNLNAFIGNSAGITNTGGSLNTLIGSFSDVATGSLSNASAIGARSFVSQSNSLVLGSINGVNGATSSTNVGIGTTAPGYPLDIQGRLRLRQPLPTDAANTAGLFLARNDAGGNPIDTAFIGMRNNTSVGFYSGQLVAWPLYVETDTGFVTVTTLGSAGSTQLCRNANSQIATCSSSIQYKSNVTSFGSGLDLIRKLRPVSFTWINGGMADMGLVAEEVASVEPLLTTTNSKGEVEGVKYDRIGVVAVNAINQQQAQIEAQQKRIHQLEAELRALKELVCSTNGAASICKER